LKAAGSEAVQDADAHCAALVREGDKDRFLASLFAPAERRRYLFALYAFNVEIARVGQVAQEALAGEIRLQWWRDALAGPGHGEVRANPVAAALLDTVAHCGLPAAELVALIDAHGADLYEESMPSLEALEAYARDTAGRLFDLAALILDGRRVGLAGTSSGIAYGLAGILRAFPYHAARGRVFLPLDMLERHRVTGDSILAGKPSVGLAAVLAELRARTREHLAEAERHWHSVTPAAMPALLPLALVRPLLARMDGNPDPFAPIELPRWRRQWLLWRAARRGIF
jgi:15-cis-phytoene synthase